jgi:type II secretion system protein N
MKARFLGYAIFVVCCFCIAVYRHFPVDTASTYVQQALSKFNPNFDIDIKEIKPVFPPGIKTDTLMVNYSGIPLMGLEKFKLGVALSSVFSDTRRYPFKGSTKEGTLSGNITSEKNQQGQIGVESEFKSLVFDHLYLGRYLYDLHMSGVLTGKIAGKFDKQKVKTGQGDFFVENALFDLNALDFWMDEIAFSSVAVMFTMPDPVTLKIETCRMKGTQLDLESSGEIKIAPLFENSRLDLAVSILLHPRFFMEAGNSIPAEMARGNYDGTKLDLIIQGTLQNPKIEMLQEKQ